MSEPTCECGHSRFDHELPDYQERPGACTEWDCECPWYEGPDQEDLDTIDEFKNQLRAIGAANETIRQGDRTLTTGPSPAGVSFAAAQHRDDALPLVGRAGRGAGWVAGLGVVWRPAARAGLTCVAWLTGCVRSGRPALASSVTQLDRPDRPSRYPSRQVQSGQVVRLVDARPVVDQPRVLPIPRRQRPVRSARGRAASPGPGFGGGNGGDAA